MTKYFLCCLFASLLMSNTSDKFAETANLTVKVTNIKKFKGQIQMGLYNKATDFPKLTGQYRMKRINVDAASESYTFRNLPKGEYAVAIFHDVNSDKKMNTNLLGIPKEAYAFSNNIKPRFSTPTFQQTKLKVYKNTNIQVKLLH